MSRVRLVLLLPLVATGMAAVPSALDPLSVAPHMHDLAFENDRVRVLKSTIRTGETPPLHSQLSLANYARFESLEPLSCS